MLISPKLARPTMHLISRLLNRFRPKLAQLNSAGCTDTGIVRQANEDSFALDPALKIFLVSDGMGGHTGGALASRLAISAALTALTAKRIRKSRNNPVACRHLLSQAFRQANDEVLHHAGKDANLSGMGCTMICALVSGEKAHLCHVGDVRGYLLRQGELQQITSDHSLAAEDNSPGLPKNIVTRCIGVTMEQDPEYHVQELAADDRLLLCSDGLWNMVSDEEITAALTQESEPEPACARLIELANEAGGHDNITALVIQVSEI
ncbi:MAG: protein phosphatase 2C domain-containing protein [Thermodesulfobacteriota bacterium]